MKSQTRLSVRSINQSNRSISVRLSFLFCSRAFISRSYENRSMWHLSDIMFVLQNFLLFSSHLKRNNKEARKSIQPQHITICIQAHLHGKEISNRNVAAEYHKQKLNNTYCVSHESTRTVFELVGIRQHWYILYKIKIIFDMQCKKHFIGTQPPEFVKIQVRRPCLNKICEYSKRKRVILKQ